MNVNDIRMMSDEELQRFLDSLKKKDCRHCIKCGKPIVKIIKIENQDTLQMRKLCGLCENDYQELLKYLGAFDINWD